MSQSKSSDGSDEETEAQASWVTKQLKADPTLQPGPQSVDQEIMHSGIFNTKCRRIPLRTQKKISSLRKKPTWILNKTV